MADELARWAAGRAPDILARAEAEAVAALRDALIAAATTEHRAQRREPEPERRAPTPAPAPAPRAAAEGGTLLWSYGVTRGAPDIPLPEVTGIAGAPVRAITHGELSVLVSAVPAAEFGAEPLRENLNDLAWLETSARAHEAVLEAVLGRTTIVPLRLCTLYETEGGARQMLAREHDTLLAALDALAGREEWGAKLLVDPSALSAAADARCEPDATDEALGTGGEGGAYLRRRRRDRQARDHTRNIAAALAEEVHGELAKLAVDAVTLPPQNRELSRHEGEMVLNAAYLVDVDAVEGFRAAAAGLEARHGELGARLQLTGPWPPYNFVPGDGMPAVP